MITCQFEDGGKTSLRHMTMSSIIIKDGKVLLGKRATYNNGKPLLEAGKWGLIGGFMKRDENLLEGIRREVMEETGWEIDDIKLFIINDNPNRPAEDRQNVEIIFIARAKKRTGGSDEEMSQLEWFDLNNLPEDKLIAFDFSDHLKLYKKYLVEKFDLPLFGKTAKN